ncbi:MAG: 4-(cytidine 5'-diphospho)-2-C-methyl-D-erythritol kinase, partial [Lachnospiraceae bacterium]|nr:4-(cytidine 5'-diphospho)-2-C-methyl-D-erythritol kinase [Lachnospiraceae bacterium]
ITDGMRVRLTKNIPVAAGLAGGSSDCAAALKAMNKIYGLGLSPEELAAYGVRLGADVPYCLMGGTAISEGIGEILTPLPSAPFAHVLLVKPPVGISTKEAYAAYDREPQHEHPDIDGLIHAIEARDLRAMCASMGNVLEPVSVGMHPEIEDIKAKMKELGAAGSMMSGSGSTVFGLFEEKEAAGAAGIVLKETYPGAEIFLTGFADRNDL